MNTIKLPVRVTMNVGEETCLVDANGLRVSRWIHGDSAHEFAIALNCHDALVDVLTRIRDHTDADSETSYRCDDREGCLDTCHAIARDALAKMGNHKKQ